MEERRPLIVDVARGRLEDGPGIRSVAFFKGCPLRCSFCQNPEAQAPEPEIAFFADKCVDCRRCLEVCPESAIIPDLPGRIDRRRCTRCGLCAEVCPGGGLRLVGRYHPPEDLADLLTRDRSFQQRSRGGVTLSGGEATLFPEYLEALLPLLKSRGVHIALQTCGLFDPDVFLRTILPCVDLIFFDLKIIDDGEHQWHTGRSNATILDNLRRLIARVPDRLHLRTPMIPGVTTTRANLRALKKIHLESGLASITFLPYNPLGLDMYAHMGRKRPNLPTSFMKPHEEREILKYYRSHDPSVGVGCPAC